MALSLQHRALAKAAYSSEDELEHPRPAAVAPASPIAQTQARHLACRRICSLSAAQFSVRAKSASAHAERQVGGEASSSGRSHGPEPAGDPQGLSQPAEELRGTGPWGYHEPAWTDAHTGSGSDADSPLVRVVLIVRQPAADLAGRGCSDLSAAERDGVSPRSSSSSAGSSASSTSPSLARRPAVATHSKSRLSLPVADRATGSSGSPRGDDGSSSPRSPFLPMSLASFSLLSPRAGAGPGLAQGGAEAAPSPPLDPISRIHRDAAVRRSISLSRLYVSHTSFTAPSPQQRQPDVPAPCEASAAQAVGGQQSESEGKAQTSDHGYNSDESLAAWGKRAGFLLSGSAGLSGMTALVGSSLLVVGEEHGEDDVFLGSPPSNSAHKCSSTSYTNAQSSTFWGDAHPSEGSSSGTFAEASGCVVRTLLGLGLDEGGQPERVNSVKSVHKDVSFNFVPPTVPPSGPRSMLLRIGHDASVLPMSAGECLAACGCWGVFGSMWVPESVCQQVGA